MTELKKLDGTSQEDVVERVKEDVTVFILSQDEARVCNKWQLIIQAYQDSGCTVYVRVCVCVYAEMYCSVITYCCTFCLCCQFT